MELLGQEWAQLRSWYRTQLPAMRHVFRGDDNLNVWHSSGMGDTESLLFGRFAWGCSYALMRGDDERRYGVVSATLGERGFREVDGEQLECKAGMVIEFWEDAIIWPDEFESRSICLLVRDGWENARVFVPRHLAGIGCMIKTIKRG